MEVHIIPETDGFRLIDQELLLLIKRVNTSGNGEMR